MCYYQGTNIVQCLKKKLKSEMGKEKKVCLMDSFKKYVKLEVRRMYGELIYSPCNVHKLSCNDDIYDSQINDGNRMCMVVTKTKILGIS
jgi:hypothetical protein